MNETGKRRVELVIFRLGSTDISSMDNSENIAEPSGFESSKNENSDVKKENDKAFKEDIRIKFPQPEIWPEKNTTFQKKKKKKLKLVTLLNMKIMCSILSKVCLISLGYLISYMSGSLILLPITVISLICCESLMKKPDNRIKQKNKACSSTKGQLLEKLEELPSWVMFPDRERAEWINDIILHLWPNMNCYLAKFVRTKLEKQIKKKYDSFKFEEIDFGKTPPKIDGVKVYNRTRTRDSILIDFDIFYDGDCEINFSVSGHQVGTLKYFQLSVEVRVVLKPLMLKAPIIGGIQVFFLNTPEIDFELDGLSGIPGLSHVLRKQLEEKIRKKIVFPNKITKRFTKTVEATELESLEPEGVLRIHIAEAKELERRDVTGKSDPYAVFAVGAQEYKTAVIKRSLNPKWDEWCEFVILDPIAQQVKFRLFDHDDLNEDDFLGSGVIDIKSIYDGCLDLWVGLDGVKHGKIHLRFTWMSLTSDYNALDKVLHETKLLKVPVSSALLTVYVDSVRNLSRIKSFKKPDPYLLMQIGQSPEQKTKIKKHTQDPIYEEGFSFLVKNPDRDLFCVNIMDKSSSMRIDYFEYEIKKLIEETNLEFSMREIPLKSGGQDCIIVISMQLRILTSESFTEDAESSESFSETELSRNESFKSRTSVHASPVPETPLPDSEDHSIGEIMAKKNTSPLKSPIFRRFHLNNKSLSTDFHHDASHNLGRINVGFEYSERRQKLLLTIFSIENLPLKDPKDIPDPYVKVKLFSTTSTVRHKTKTVMDNINPEFKETFEYLLSPGELLEQKLVLSIKTKKKLFSNNMLGQVFIDLKDIDFNQHPTKWYNIGHEEHSD